MNSKKVEKGINRKRNARVGVVGSVAVLTVALSGCSSTPEQNARSPHAGTSAEATPSPACHEIKDLGSVLLTLAQVESVLPDGTTIPGEWLQRLTKQHTAKPAAVLAELPGSAEPGTQELDAYHRVTVKIAHEIGVTNGIMAVYNKSLAPGTVEVLSGYDSGTPCVPAQQSIPSDQSV